MFPALRMRSLPVWIAVSVAVCPSVAAQQDDPWSECVVEDLGGTARRVRCSGMSVSLSRSPTMAQDGWLESMAADIADGATITREQLDVEGRPTLLRIVPGERLSVIASPRPETVAMCEVEPAQLDRCRAAIAWIIRRGLPPGVVFPEPLLELLGRPLRIPPGCRLVGAERIRCPSGEALAWQSTGPDGPRETIASYASVLRTRFPHVTPEEVPCIVAGRVGLGARFVLGPAVTILCVVGQRTGAANAQCIGDLQPGAPWPEPCAQVFQGTVPR